ncbi:hypothetical protein QZM99_00620 [Burkholderia gladioli]|uniref:hypothetical protein n=1 Tax=Burkholderia gladioli TaxID=28095 RepID=UPI002655CDB6|nr:hypothetical protein [Burkholderia gladioli]MDN7916594.1 hypothetical protein [Burkholderia gladioli]
MATKENPGRLQAIGTELAINLVMQLTVSRITTGCASIDEAVTEAIKGLRELDQALTGGEPAPGVQKLAEARAALEAKEDAGKKQDSAVRNADASPPPTGATAAAAAPAEPTTPESSKPGPASASTPTSSNDEPRIADGNLKPWHEKTAALYAELKDVPPSLESCKKAIVGISTNAGRDQAEALLARFGANVVSPKPGKKHLDEAMFGQFMDLAVAILAGTADATEAEFKE